MRSTVVFAFLALAVILGVPFVMRSAAPADLATGVPKIIIITPHVRQISEEFGVAFKRWHKHTRGSEVEIDWRGPFGTSEIVKLLQAQYTAAMRRELDRVARESPERLLDPAFTLDDAIKPGDIGFDLFFGGGSFDHTRVKTRENASVAVAVLPGGSIGTVVLTNAEQVQEANLATLREFKADASIDGKPAVRLRIPVAAVEGGLDALSPLTKGVNNLRLTLDTSQLLRDFTVRMSAKAGLTSDELAPLGDGIIGADRLFDPEQYWIGTALSSFGIVFNRELMEDAGFKKDPTTFADLTNPNLAGLVALADPRQSGSFTTTIDMILSSYVWRAAAVGGWSEMLAERGGLDKARASGNAEAIDEAWRQGWRTLREMTANARYFASSSTKPPLDVSQGEAAAGLAIDFYGKSQAQAILRPGQLPADSRVGYVDPLGESNYDADPVTILVGGPNAALAQDFVRFCLTKEAQAIWQFPPGSVNTPKAPDGRPMGPERHALRRLPVRRDMYEPPYFEHFIDQVRPFERAPKAPPVGWRNAVAVMMPAFSVDVLDDQHKAWAALRAARRDNDFPRERLGEMERLFYSFPTTKLPDGREVEFTPENFGAIAAAWRSAQSAGRMKQDYALAYTRFFRENYREVVRLSRR
jgi:ABC-type Fe3+ transport system substrate-binding protein